MLANNDHHASSVLVEARPVEKAQRVDVRQIGFVRSTQTTLVPCGMCQNKTYLGTQILKQSNANGDKIKELSAAISVTLQPLTQQRRQSLPITSWRALAPGSAASLLGALCCRRRY